MIGGLYTLPNFESQVYISGRDMDEMAYLERMDSSRILEGLPKCILSLQHPGVKQ